MENWLGEVIASVGSGSLVGFSLGLIGGGGSILATPLLLYVVGIKDPHMAIGTGALAVSANAYAGLIGHARRGTVWWRCALVFGLVGTIGVLAGSTLGKAVGGQTLLFLFAFVMLAVGVAMLRPRRETDGVARTVDGRMCFLTGAVALASGFASGFFGIGGGFLIVPGLILATGMPTINAVGTSLFAVGTFGLVTALNYALSGWVDWLVAAEFIAGGIGGGWLGTALAARLSVNKNALNRIFAGLIFVVAIYVLYRSASSLFGK
ncbi:MAG: sulfite exporter TauE/SafE family protein [Asticcacaulis sp.]